MLPRLTGVRRGGRGIAAKCPAHDDKKQSLGLAEDDGRILIKCYAGCSTQSVITALGITWKDLFNEHIKRPSRETLGDYERPSLPDCYARSPDEPRIHCVYPYVDANNVLLYENVRFHPKGFRQRHFDASGKPVWHLNVIRDIKKRSLNKQQRVFEPV